MADEKSEQLFLSLLVGQHLQALQVTEINCERLFLLYLKLWSKQVLLESDTHHS